MLRAISPLIWRRLLVRSESTLADLHEILQVAFGWEDVHLNRFEIRGRGYEVYRDGGGMTGIDAEDVRLCDLNVRCLERFDYEYDFGDGWIHDIRLEKVLPADPKMIYPTCVAGKCAAPPEDCGGPYVFMSNRARYCDIGSGESREDLDDWGGIPTTSMMRSLRSSAGTTRISLTDARSIGPSRSWLQGHMKEIAVALCTT